MSNGWNGASSDSLIYPSDHDSAMDANTAKKLGVVGSVILMVLLLAFVPVAYFVMEVPAPIVAGVSVVFIALIAVLLYCAVERFKEIEEGLDDAVDDY